MKCLNILLADDENEIAMIISSVLRKAGHSIEVVNDGRAAFMKLKENAGHYHMLITDGNMPEMSGVELIEQLPAIGFRGKIILLSGYLTAELEDEYGSLPIDRIIQKPFLFSDFTREVEEVAATVECNRAG